MKIKEYINKLLTWTPENEYEFELPKENTTQNNFINDNELNIPKNVFSNIDSNLEYMQTRYNFLISNDIVIREFIISVRNKQYKSFILFIDGMVDSDLINNFILKPLMLKNNANSFDGEENRIISESKNNNVTIRKIKKFDIGSYISDCLLPQNNIKKDTSFDDIVFGINSGNCALFVDTLNICFDIDVKGFKQRSIDTPRNEIVIKGPHEAFVENIRTNTSMIRRIINNENLIVKTVEVGSITKTKCAVCYMKDIANEDLISEVEFRLNNINIDSLLSAGQLEQLIVDDNDLGIPRVLSTERPDTSIKYLLQGRVIVIVNGTPFALVMPATLIDLISTPEDLNLKVKFSNFLRFIRIIAAGFTLLLPRFICSCNFISSRNITNRIIIFNFSR